MYESLSELASKYRRRADHYRELATIARNPEMRVTFLQAFAAYDRAATMAEIQASEEHKSAMRR
jgi:hypothetical protein